MNKRNMEINEERKFAWRVVLIASFVLLMGTGFVVGCFLLFLRPEKSELEKRELTRFPAFSTEDLMDGTYTSNIERWFADTFPFRENLLLAEQRIKVAYGIRSDAINNVGEGDDIPDLDDLINNMSTEAPSQTVSTETTIAESEEIAETTNAVEETTAEKTYEAIDGKDVVAMNPQEAGKVNIKDLVGYCVFGFNLTAADTYCQDVADMQAAAGENVKVYDILVPNNSAITLDEATKADWKLSDERKVINYYQAKINSLDSRIRQVSIYDTLEAHSSEYLYFKTDHHWTQLAAYYAYVEFCKEKGVAAHDLSEYERVESGAFLGSYYAANGFTQLEGNPDDVISYIPLSTNEMHFYDVDMQGMRTGKIIRNMSEFGPTLKYYGYIYGDNPYSYIDNPAAVTDEVCVLIKESFGNNFVPFLVDHYKKVIIVDYRSYKDAVSDIVKEENVTDIVFLNNLEAISDTPTMQVLGNICR